MKRTPRSSPPRSSRQATASQEPFSSGQKIRDVRNDQTGVILEFACQYAHPKADPVYNYLIRWEDGQVQAVSEAALMGGNGYEVLE